ncbi:MAG: hypothetical protein HY046_09785 [Acidobacteria bacterium]|nr:hypothetical protein [Acidobacteriota bacterium]
MKRARAEMPASPTMSGNLYLTTAEFALYGLADSTDPALIRVASDLADAFCKRDSILVTQYFERNKLPESAPITRATFTPLAIVSPATTPFIAARARHGVRRGAGVENSLAECVAPFGGPPAWVDLTPLAIEYNAVTGEIWLPTGIFGTPNTEVELTYTAGYTQVPDVVKLACAQIIRNAESHPAGNVQIARLDRMRLDYFAESLMDEDVKRLLAPFVAIKMN